MPAPPIGEIVLYQTEDGRTRVECRFAEESIWLTQALIATLFDVTVPTVNEHLRHLFEEGELDPDRTIRKFLIVRLEGARKVEREIEHYNLDAILAVENKLHFTATGHTAPEIIAAPADPPTQHRPDELPRRAHP